MNSENFINPSKLLKLLELDYTFIDLRESDIFKLSHLPKFVNIPCEIFDQCWKIIKTNEPIILICSQGSTSAYYASLMQKNNITCFSVYGGIKAIPKINDSSIF